MVTEDVTKRGHRRGYVRGFAREIDVITMAFNKSYVIDNDIRDLAERVVKVYADCIGYIDTDRILFIRETLGGMSKAAAKCRLVQEPYASLLSELGHDVDWIIEFYSYHTEGKSPEWLAILMLHELMHIGADGKIVDHDIKDFRDILRGVGVDWSSYSNLPDIITDKIALHSLMMRNPVIDE